MFGHPRGQIRESIGRIDLKLERLGILLLAAGALQINDKLTRHGQCDARPEVLFNQSKGEIDTSGDSTGSVEGAVFQVEGVVIDTQLGKTFGDIVSKAPVGGDAAVIKETGGRERVD